MGKGGTTLTLDLKWGMPGFQPGGLIYFSQPESSFSLIAPPVQGVYRVTKVVDKFDATNNVFSQSLTCKR